MLYLYYAYVKDFGVEPDSIAALFERTQFITVQNKVYDKIMQQVSK